MYLIVKRKKQILQKAKKKRKNKYPSSIKNLSKLNKKNLKHKMKMFIYVKRSQTRNKSHKIKRQVMTCLPFEL